jgi:hypothetical protein
MIWSQVANKLGGLEWPTISGRKVICVWPTLLRRADPLLEQLIYNNFVYNYPVFDIMKRIYFYYPVDNNSQFASILCRITPLHTPTMSYKIKFNSAYNLWLGLIVLPLFEVTDKIIYAYVISFTPLCCPYIERLPVLSHFTRLII